MAKKVSPDNIARGKPTAQSSVNHGGVSQRAVDGNTNSNWGGNSCIHTRIGAHPWWRVDLLRPYAVVKVKITGRGDCCWRTQLRNYEVRVGNHPSKPYSKSLLFKGAGESADLEINKSSLVSLNHHNFSNAEQSKVYGVLDK